MELNKNFGIGFFPSLREELVKKVSKHGGLSLQINAAIAMYLFSAEEEQEKWISMVERARRSTSHDASPSMYNALKLFNGIALDNAMRRDVVTPPTPARPEIEKSLTDSVAAMGDLEVEKQQVPGKSLPSSTASRRTSKAPSRRRSAGGAA